MDLKQFASPIAARHHFVKVSFGGFSGSGKSRTGGEFAAGVYKDLKLTKPILIIDNEKGSRFLIPFFKKLKIPTLLKDTTRLADVIQAMEFLQKGEIDLLFMDSLSKVWYQYVRDYKEKNRITFMALDHWGKILPAWQEEFSDRFVDCPGNIIFTGRGGFSYSMEEEENEQTGKTKKRFVQSGVKMKLAGETPFEPDLNVWMEMRQQIVKGSPRVWREAQIMKDRSGIIDGKTFKNPTYKDFQPVVKFLLDVPTGDVAGESNTENRAPAEDYGWMKRKQEREIEVEKIRALFDAAAIGTSKDDKQVKAIIFQRLIGTTSQTEFEKMPIEALSLARINLERLFERWEDVAPEYRLQFVKEFKVLTEPPVDDAFGGLFDGVDASEQPEGTGNGFSKRHQALLADIAKAKSESTLVRVLKKVNAAYGTDEITDDENTDLLNTIDVRRKELAEAKAEAA